MNCGAFDTLLCDYLDTTLRQAERIRLEQHAAGCPACAEKLSDMEFAMGFLRDTPRVEPPAELISEILQGTVGATGPLTAPAPAGAGAQAAVMGLFRGFFHPLVEPRFAMSLAMVALSFSMITLSWQRASASWETRGTGPIAAALQAGEQFEQAWERGVDLYENLRMSYQVESEFGTNGAGPGGNARPRNAPSEPTPPSEKH